MPAEKKLRLRCAFGSRLTGAVLLAAHPDEMYDEQGSPRRDARTLVLRLQGERAVFLEELPVPLVACWYSTSGTAYCGSVERNSLYTWRAGAWSEEIFSESPVEVTRYVYAYPGETAADDVVFVAATKRLYVRQRGKWQSKRVPGEGRPYQMVGTKPDQVYVGGTDLFVWNGKKLEQFDEPHDDTPKLLALTADDRLIAGRTFVSASTVTGEWERIPLPMELFTEFARLGDDVYALHENGVVRVHPGVPQVVSHPIPDAWGMVAVGDGLIAFGSNSVLAFDGTKWFDIEMPLCEVGKLPR